MTNFEKNSAEKINFSEEEEKLMNRIGWALVDEETIQFEQKLGNYFPKKSFWQQNWSRAAAAILIITASSIVYYFNTSSNIRIYNRYYSHFPIENTTGTLRGIEDQKSRAYQYFAENDFKNSLLTLDSIAKKETTNYEIQFLLGICFCEEKQFGEASNKFEFIVNSETNFYTDDATWYLALLKIREKNYMEGKKLLQTIDKSSVYFSRANELLEKINQ